MNLPKVGDKIRTQQATTDNDGRLTNIKAKGVVTKIEGNGLYPIVMEGINERKEDVLLYVRKDGWTEWK